MDHHRGLKRGFLAVFLGLLVGCLQLPEYARPRFHEPENAASIAKEGFLYRCLSVDDFQAASLPSEYSQFDHHINAHSCISIRPAPNLKVHITLGKHQGRVFYMGRIPEVTFEAIFVPACSWWNPELDAKRKAYVLEHEQIHFALAELAARKLNRDVREELKDYVVINDTLGKVQEELKAKLRGIAHAAMQASFEDHTEFDEETSLFHNPRAQRWWLEDVQKRLAAETP